MYSRPSSLSLVAATLALTTSLLVPRPVEAQLRVVTTLPDLASIAELVGGEHVDVFSIATGYQNPHFVDPKPSYITRLARADVFVTVGLDLEIGWVPPLLQSSRNADIIQGGRGYVDASAGVPLLQVPENVSREQGDIHIYGNPHYWLDPERGKIIAANIAEALIRLQPDARADIEAGLQAFRAEIDRRLEEWLGAMEPFRGTQIVAYHNQWPYLEERFGLEIVDFLEPKPGIPPTPSQLARIIRLMEGDGPDVIIISPYYRKDNADLVARRTGAQVVELATSVGAFDGIDDYFDLFDYNVDLLVDALSAP